MTSLCGQGPPPLLPDQRSYRKKPRAPAPSFTWKARGSSTVRIVTLAARRCAVYAVGSREGLGFQGLWPPSSHRPDGARDQFRSSRSTAHQAARRRHLHGEAARGIDQSASERSLGWDAAFQMLTWLTLAEAAWPLPVPAAQELMALSSEAKLSRGSDGSMLDWEASSELTCSPLTKTSTLGQRPEFDGAGVAWETTAGPVDGVLDGVVAVLAGGVLDDVAVLAGGVLDDDVAVLAGGVLDDDVAVLAGCMPA